MMVEVTQEDRGIVDHAWLSTHEKAALARHVARHRIAAEQRAKLEGARLALEAAHQSVAEVVNKGTADYCFGALDPAKIVGEG